MRSRPLLRAGLAFVGRFLRFDGAFLYLAALPMFDGAILPDFDFQFQIDSELLGDLGTGEINQALHIV